MFLSAAGLLVFCCIQQTDSFAVRGCDVHTHMQSFEVKVLCYNRDLKSVPEQLPSNTFILDISMNKIEVIKIGDFRNITLLENLNASSNHIHAIERGSFLWLTALQILKLDHNKLRFLNNSMFDGLQNTTFLSLKNNSIISIQSMALIPLQNLKVIDLSSNPFQTLDAIRPVFQLTNLQEIYIVNVKLQMFSSSDLGNNSIPIHTIDLSRNPLDSINFTTNALQDITFLDISFSRPVEWTIKDACFLRALKRIHMEGIALIPAAVLRIIQSLNCSSLVEINLSQLNLMDTDDIIQGICLQHSQLQTLYLRANNYTRFKNNTFQNCSALQVLDLSDNQFVHIPASYFHHLASLDQLSLAKNQLAALPEDLSELRSLKQMNLSYNHLEKVYLNETQSLHNLTHLDLSGNIISEFHSSSPLNWSLEHLNLGVNHILDISKSFGNNLKKLKNLILRVNKLSYLSLDTFQNLTSLKFLNLADNQIERIEPRAFNGLHNLQTLILGSNKITRQVFQNDTFQGLESLVELQLFSNYIEYENSRKLAESPFHALTSLKLLTLNSQGHNGMRNLPVNFLEGLVSLYKIHLGNLAMSTIDINVFSYVPQLKELDLSNNPIPVLEPDLLKPVCSLTELHLNRMTLQSLDFLLVSKLSKLTLLRVEGNQLNTFNESHRNSLPALKFLDLRSNPLICSCDNLWFINWVKRDTNTQVLHFYEYKCAYPPSTKGNKLYLFHTESCRPSYDYNLFLSTCVILSIWLLLSTVWKLWRWHVVYCYYLILGYFHDRRSKKLIQTFEYDAFISYNCHNEEWVFKQLMPNLEENNNWKLCLHHRDFEPGKAIVDNITDSIYSSRKTICVISRHYLESEWCSKEMQVASYRLFDEHADVLILLFLEDIPHHRLSPYHRIRGVLKKKTYLVWPRNINARPVFWHKVNQALQDNNALDRDNAE